MFAEASPPQGPSRRTPETNPADSDVAAEEDEPCRISAIVRAALEEASESLCAVPASGQSPKALQRVLSFRDAPVDQKDRVRDS